MAFTPDLPLKATGANQLQTVTASAFRTLIGVGIGSDVQGFDAGLESIAGLTTAADNGIYTTALNVYATYSLTSFGRTVCGYASAAALKTGIGIATAQAYTQTYSTADRTISAYTASNQSSAYTGQDNAQAGTVYAKLTDLNTLRAAYETLRAHCEDIGQAVNAIIDDLQTAGIVT